MTPTKFITGRAGTGKSTLIKQLDKTLLCSTTGISAVNMGTVTINSLLAYYNTEGMIDKHVNGKLVERLANQLPRDYSLVVDEVSMMDAPQLDVLLQTMDELNAMRGTKSELILTGDFLQLPVVKGKWLFESPMWEREGWHTQKLIKVWRQDNPEFLAGLNALRMGRGAEAEANFSHAKVETSIAAVQDFPGVTIMGLNKEVDDWNERKYSAINSPEVIYRNTRTGIPLSEWKIIPHELRLKVGAHVMILANRTVGGFMGYANGDLGIIKDLHPYHGPLVELLRNKDEVRVSPVKRLNTEKDKATGVNKVLGSISYWPLRLAYASTVHKTQGLTLEMAQVDLRGWMMGQPAMTYVACSRVRSPEGLRLVGHNNTLRARCAVSKGVERWL